MWGRAGTSGGHPEEGSRRLWLNPGYRYITSTQKEAQRRDLAPCSTLQRGWAYSLPLPPIFFLIWIFFWWRPFLKSLLNLLQYCFCFIYIFFGHKTCEILTPQPRVEDAPPILKGKILTTGLPGKSLPFVLKLATVIHTFFVHTTENARGKNIMDTIKSECQFPHLECFTLLLWRNVV